MSVANVWLLFWCWIFSNGSVFTVSDLFAWRSWELQVAVSVAKANSLALWNVRSVANSASRHCWILWSLTLHTSLSHTCSMSSGIASYLQWSDSLLRLTMKADIVSPSSWFLILKLYCCTINDGGGWWWFCTSWTISSKSLCWVNLEILGLW